MATQKATGATNVTKLNSSSHTFNHSEEWLEQAAQQVEFSPELLETLRSVFGYGPKEALDIFYDKDQSGNFYKRAAKFDLNQDQLVKLQEINDNNRDVNTGYKIHQENLQNGTFQCTPDPIMINQTGKMVNGGHRTKGGVKAKVETMPMFVMINATEEENMAYDQGKKRTGKAISKMFKDDLINSDSRYLSFCNMASTLGYMGASRQAVGFTNAQHYFNENKDRILDFFKFFDSLGFDDQLNKRGVHRALYLVMFNTIDIDGKEFIEEFATKENAKSDLTILRKSIENKLTDSESKIINNILMTSYEWSGQLAGDRKDRVITNLFREVAPEVKSAAVAS